MAVEVNGGEGLPACGAIFALAFPLFVLARPLHAARPPCVSQLKAMLALKTNASFNFTIRHAEALNLAALLFLVASLVAGARATPGADP